VAALKKPIIIGAVVLGGLVVLSTALLKSKPAANGDDTEESSDAASEGGSFFSSGGPHNSGRQLTATEQAEAERRARQIELEAAAAAQFRRGHTGVAGSPAAAAAARYKSDPQGIGEAIIGVTPALRDCYEGFGRLNQKLPDDVHVRVTIEPDPKDPNRGIVTRAETAESDFQHPSVEGCLRSAVSSLTFERMSKPVQANLPLVLQRHN
jgi:hypothetical protein